MIALMERLDTRPQARRDKIEARAADLVAEEMNLRDVRQAMTHTEERVAEKLGIKQENVSRIERRADLLISTLRGYVEAMGGKLHLVAGFPDHPAIELSGLAVMDKDRKTDAAQKQ